MGEAPNKMGEKYCLGLVTETAPKMLPSDLHNPDKVNFSYTSYEQLEVPTPARFVLLSLKLL